MTKEQIEKQARIFGWIALLALPGAAAAGVYGALGSRPGFYTCLVLIAATIFCANRYFEKARVLVAMEKAGEMDRELEARRAMVAEPQYADLVSSIYGLDSGDIVTARDPETEEDLMWIVYQPMSEKDDLLWAREATGIGENEPYLSDILGMKNVIVLRSQSSTFVPFYQAFWQRRARSGGGIEEP